MERRRYQGSDRGGFPSEGSGMMLAVGRFNGRVTVYNLLDEREEPARVELDTHGPPAEVPAMDKTVRGVRVDGINAN
ncbi:hypothetical protein N7530_012330 [Penicillium desertorum]|uniref:Uncharacterized protein n=1 Tax=Penicillium desertorum TaxID=1303715 RepID=A0A9W9WFC3_9EURO|nr:hypothetical protein N7530_012330 [Penicillium desertorum]